MAIKDPEKHYIDENDYKRIDPNPPAVYAGETYDGVFKRNAEENARKRRNLMHGTAWLEKGKREDTASGKGD